MTRNQYLSFRQTNNMLGLLHAYYNEVAFPAYLSFDQFRFAVHYFIERHLVELNQQVSDDFIFNKMVDVAIDYFDKKFSIVYVLVERKKTIKEKITIIL